MAIDLPNIYNGNYRLLMAVPIALVLLSLIFIPGVELGVDFKGGTMVTMQANQSVDEGALRAALTDAGFEVSSVKSLANPAGYEIEVEIERDGNLTRAEQLKTDFFSKIDEVSRLESDVMATNSSPDAVSKYMEARKSVDGMADGLFEIAGMPGNASGYPGTNELKATAGVVYRKILDENSERLTQTLSRNVQYESASFNQVSASLSDKFVERVVAVVIYSIIIVSIAVFLIFRTLVPSLAVLIGAACDLVIALGAMGLLGIPLTLASFAALLMLVGFSLDTDVLLTMRLIKRKEGTARERAYEAMKTGTTMSMALLLSFSCLFILAMVTHINTYFEISAVALVGLVGDLIATWMLNAPIVLSYMEKKGDAGKEEKPFLSSIFSG
ncbi:MAG: hypothetical protein WC588_00855 [Candidatus Micrarchaeia archaeon]